MNQSHHYYAATAYAWATAGTRDEAVNAVARNVGTNIIKQAKKMRGGLLATVCRVELPEAAHYTIDDYMPQLITKEDGVSEARKGEPVPISEREDIRITTASGKSVAA